MAEGEEVEEMITGEEEEAEEGQNWFKCYIFFLLLFFLNNISNIL